MTYFEYWSVKKGEVIDSERNNPDGVQFPFTDEFSFANEETCGFEAVIGEIRFYCRWNRRNSKVPGTGLAPQAPYTGQLCGKITDSGSLPATTTVPNFWNFPPVERYEGTHFSMRHWNCCPGQRNFDHGYNTPGVENGKNWKW